MSVWVKTVDPTEATGRAKHFYETVRLGPDGSIPKLVKAWSLQADVADTWLQNRDSATEGSGLDERQYEVLLTRVVYNFKCAYVTRNHAWILFQQGHYSKDEIIQIVHDWPNSVLDDQDKALLAFADKMCFRSHELQLEDIEALRHASFTDAQIVALSFLVGWLITDAVVPNAFGLGDGDDWTSEMQAVIDWK
ncbi:MAG: carboxymuconolactone decarboxylase family protein [Acidimicrobiales bacterium]